MIRRAMELTGRTRSEVMDSRELPLPTCRGLMWRRLHTQGFGYWVIGRYFGRKHCTVLYGIRRASELLLIGDKITNDINSRLK